MSRAKHAKTGSGIKAPSAFSHDILMRSAQLINIALMTAPFIAVWLKFYEPKMNDPYGVSGDIAIILLWIFIYVLMIRTYDGFLVSLKRISEVIYSQALSVLIADVIMYVIICLLLRTFAVPWPMLACLVAQFIICTVWSKAAHQWYFRTFPAKNTIIVYDQREGMEQLISEYGLEKKFHVVDSFSAHECIHGGKLEELQNVEAVFLCGVHSKDRNVIIKYCVAHNVGSYIIPRIGDVLMSGAKRLHMFHVPILRVTRYNPPPEFLFAKRAGDIVLSGLALIVLSPVLLVTAILIRAEDGGPVFYKQVRLTKDGKHFKIVKFRSMRTDAEKDGVARLSSGENDDRITKIGRKIRALRIDELPQLINILKGDLSIVGPRPERPEIAAEYEKTLPEFSLRLQGKAGLTGVAQVYGKYNTTPYDKLMMDLMYFAHPSLLNDLRIIFATVKILFMPESTEGVEAGQTTAMQGARPDAEQL